MKFVHLLTVTLAVIPLLAAAEPVDFRAKAKELVAQMTLEEKAVLCSGQDSSSTKPVARLGIPSICMTDGPHGVRRAVSLGLEDSLPATCFPTASCLAASWDVELVREVGVALGQEAQALGVQWLLGPGVNMKRSPLCGRNFEYFSEDPVLAGKMGAAWIEGVQSMGVGASLKHFAANNQETDRMVNNSQVDERTLHELYLPAFEIAVKEAKPWTVMCSYNKLNGVYNSENPLLLQDILRDSWGYHGIVISDWGAVDDRVAGIRAGLNLEMPASGGLNDRRIVAAVIAGELPIARLDASVTDLLEAILRAKAAAQPNAKYDADAHQALARRAAAAGAVLLKNERQSLPLEAGRGGKIAIIGALARHPHYQGSGSSRVNPTKLENAYDELARIVGPAQLSYAAGYDEPGVSAAGQLAEATKVARAADQAIVFVGLPDGYDTEGVDRPDLELPADQNRLVEAVAAVQPNTVVVLMNGAPVVLPWAGRVKAILEAYLGGQAGGGAIADLLTGRVNPSGRLAETFPARIEDTPTYPNFPARNGPALYGEGLFIGYRYYDAKKIAPLFPFGFGLSYTTFAFTSLKVDTDHVKAADGVTVQVTVRNTGRRAGAEVVQLYVHPLGAAVVRPEKELKHFAKVMLAPGEEKTVTLALQARDFAYYDASLHDWVVDTGAYELLVGGSSRELPLRQTLQVEGLPHAYPKLTRNSSIAELGANPRGRPIYDQFLKGLPDTTAKPAKGQPPTPEEQAAAKRTREMLVKFMREMPLCKLVLVSQGQFTEETLQGILKAVNQ